jgi:pimeloyl-ACP methyl ester carboxylesterase
MVWLSLLAMLVLCAAIASGAAVVLMAEGLLRPPRMTDGKAVWVLRRLSPGDLGLVFEEVSFDVRDKQGKSLRIAAWWIPAAETSDRCVVMIHGYADAKVGVIAWAPAWHRLGFNILAIDLRAHGESGGRYCSGGTFERDDVNQVIDQLLIARPNQTRWLALFGVSFGAAVAVSAAALRDDIRAVVLDSPFVDYTRAAMRQMDRLGAPGRIFQRGAVWVAGKAVGADMSALQTDREIEKARCPVMLIQPTNDPTLSDADSERLREAVERHQERFPHDRLWLVEEAGHVLALAADADRYSWELGEFIARAISGG